jgi:hypothetical protein
MDKWSEGMVEKLCKEIGFMRGRLIGMLGGNHYWKFASGITSDELMCHKLDCKYLGVSSFIRVVFDNDGHKNVAVDIFAHHGKGAARLIGGSINKVETMREIAEADIYIMGRDHRKGAVPAGEKLELTHEMVLRYKKQWLVRSGSFLRGYVNGKPSYVADGAMPPTDLGVVIIEITPKRDRTGGKDNIAADVHCWS